MKLGVKMKKISIIIPVYNVEKYVSRCLKSVLNQTINDTEIILVDDASTDKSYDIIKSFQRMEPKKIKIIHKEVNEGPGKARNLGLKEASGEFISFIDSDDYIQEDMLEKLYVGCKLYDAEISRVNLKHMYKGINVSFLGRNGNYNNGEIINPKENLSYLLTEFPSCANKLFNHDFIEKEKFPENLKWEDFPFTIPRLVDATVVKTIPDSYYFYNLNVGGTTCGDALKFNSKILDIFECCDIVGNSCIREDTSENVKKQINFIQKQNCLQRLRDILYSNIKVEDKKELITLLSSLIEVKYGPWQNDEMYLDYKNSRKLYNLRMNIIENFFLQDYKNNLTEEELKAKIKSKIKV